MSRKPQNQHDVAGNALASAQNYARAMVRHGETIEYMERICDNYFDDDIEVDSLRVRAPRERAGEWLVIVKAWHGNKPMVAFHSALSFAEALIGTINRMRNKSLKWKEDEYASKGQGTGQS